MAIIPRNNTSDANAAGSFNTDLTMTSLVEQNENIVPYLFAIVKRDVMSAFSGNDDWTELVRRFGVPAVFTLRAVMRFPTLEQCRMTANGDPGSICEPIQ
jgi:hypothetical protein